MVKHFYFDVWFVQYFMTGMNNWMRLVRQEYR